MIDANSRGGISRNSAPKTNEVKRSTSSLGSGHGTAHIGHQRKRQQPSRDGRRTLDRHAREVVPGGGILYNERLKVVQDDLQPGVHLYPLPIRDLLQAFGRQTILQNTIALGGVFWLLSLDLEQ